MNISKFNIFLLITIFFLILFSPSILFFVSGLTLITIACSKPFNKKEYLFFCNLIIFLFGLILYVLSLPNFILFSDDFSSYYNNFLYFLDSNYKNGFNEYNYEFLFPSLNLVLSKFIYGKFPYLMKLGHIIINLLLLFITIIYVSKKEKIKINDFLLFTCCIMIFYKLPQQMHLMRQGYACYFIIMALFSNKICSKLIFIIIGSFFHLSTPIIYLIINALSKINNKKKLIAYTLLFASTFLLFYYLSKQKIFFHFPLLNKLNYIINYISSDSHVKKSVLETIKSLFYFYPLLILLIIYNIKKIHIKEGYFIIISTLFLISFSFIPGFGIRVYMPILSIFLGYYYYKFIKHLNNKFKALLLFCIFIFININWLLFSEIYYYRYPIFSSEPLYYLNSLIEEQEKICRECLPQQVEIKNKYR